MSNDIHRGARRHFLRLGTALAALACLPELAFAGAYDDYFKAVKLDLDRQVADLLKRGFDPNTIEAERGDTGLILALREDSMKVFRVLLNTGGVNLEAHARNGDTALMIAAWRGNLDAVRALIEKGAEVNQTGWTALHYAAANGHNDIVSLLLEHFAYIDAESPNGTTPIMMASRGGHIMTVKLLLDEGADATLKNGAGMTAIDFARSGNHNDIADGLTYRLKKAGKL
ncbi:ankyrin repeat domain-containing protein [Noviherbaspirillum pedocola]|uniref:Ankyrin repeat domain-containing protein n=1 Tax=Noviherbaspirillum pedocola TaxID=2801341 RepID=A0A934SUC0_9BURK|nr:ankyrin repeat domain-containing protein [Noviherbaspirillum pedocola]MBK4735709.1 ankyrin repeat domain-containing protein [Noviherbaspirillum pedocola]